MDFIATYHVGQVIAIGVRAKVSEFVGFVGKQGRREGCGQKQHLESVPLAQTLAYLCLWCWSVGASRLECVIGLWETAHCVGHTAGLIALLVVHLSQICKAETYMSLMAYMRMWSQ